MNVELNEELNSCKNNDEPLEDDFVKGVLQSGIDLRSFSKKTENELKAVENACVGDYINESSNIACLHSQITECDTILERLEGMLCTFQADLGNICQEILCLQEQSVSLNIRLKNKQLVRSELSQFIDDIVVPEAVISHVIDTPASETEFLEQLFVLDQKLTFVKEQSFKDAISCHDVMEILNNLKVKAVAKIRDYILKRIQSCKKAMTNYQIPQNALLKNKFFFTFLMAHNREVAREVQNEYIDTMNKVYFSYFKEYISRLSKLRFEELPDKDDLMAGDDSAKAKTSFFTGKPNLKNKSTIFTVGNRGNILTSELEAVSIFPHLAQKSETKFPVESIFRSVQYALLENACREYLFIADFFNVNSNTCLDLFNAVFGRTLSLLAKSSEDEFHSSYDSIGLFLSLHLVYRYRLVSHKRAVPALDAYWETLVKNIWPRFEQVFQMHIQSVKTCDVSKLSNIDTRPHFITRRYAEFSAAIMSVNDTFPDERVSILLGSLQREVENLILKVASKLSSPRQQLVFFINNYDVILSVLMERTKEESKESENLKQLLHKRIHDYVEDLLCQHFSTMICFVKDCEAYQEKCDVSAIQREEGKIGDIVKSFNGGWRKSIEEINREVLNSFTNFKCGNNIQQTALTQIIQYYHRFHKLVTSTPLKNTAVRSSLMNIHQLMVEIKKYKTTF
ncbi:vacuolar protein sorting-associated protein 52-like protein [Leptotrombidium deliense]|uniref:Vacuolar protein sorting-associated protein 52 homolog n=1 Tax=Leptotrombidium deliense TaxID=299467 RepID=A0A443SKH2_9ACAR|nr:vacuolar protein sorting-associated protein 52-like protein [Leptotrombidium deliense]